MFDARSGSSHLSQEHANHSDDALMVLVATGKAQTGLTVLQDRYARRIYHFVFGLLKDAHLAQDVTQEVFEKVFLKSHLYRTGTNFRAWLFEVARNQALSALRTRRRSPRPISSLNTDDDQGNDALDLLPEERVNRDLEEREFMTAFQGAVEHLPERYQTVFDLCVRQGLSYDDAAHRLEIPTGTVAIRIMRARRRLFRELSQHLGRIRRPPACFQ